MLNILNTCLGLKQKKRLQVLHALLLSFKACIAKTAGSDNIAQHV